MCKQIAYSVCILAIIALCLARASAEQPRVKSGLFGERGSGEIPAELLGELLIDGEASETIEQAVQRYLEEIDQIEKKAAEAKAAARISLLERLRTKQPEQAQKADSGRPGLIGTALVAGEPSGIAYHYQHGKLLPRELIWEKFHTVVDGQTQYPSVSITLVGYLEVPHEMTVKISHAAGGVAGDHGTLYVGDRKLGIVGDDTAKAEVYLITLSEGVHLVRWVLTGGMFQNNFLKFEDPRTGELLPLYFTDAQRQETGAATAPRHVEASADPSEWLKATGASNWRWVPLGPVASDDK